MTKPQGQDNWNYRPGYRHSPRVPGPIEPWQDGDRAGLGFLLCCVSAAFVIGLVWWLV